VTTTTKRVRNMNNVSVIETESVQVVAIPAGSLTRECGALLARMFADPHLLELEERRGLVTQLRQAVAEYPDIGELRVLLGMAMCVNFEIQPAIEELRTAVELAPQSFIAQLKMGELWMRLRVMDQAEHHTRQAGLLARNMAQTDVARRQAATIRTMRQNGIERGGYRLPFLSFKRLRRLLPWGANRPKQVGEIPSGQSLPDH
jgi:cytochrome c-type biogenesis protein CcmH/NrfG